MSAYYNEIDPKAAAWLRELIKAGAIAPGDVDERSIVDVRPADLRGYRQCHFFAGIGIWSYALREAGWADEREVWTGSCPCQPFSDAGAREGFQDSRHLWPVWFALIRECRPVVVFGEQVASKDGLAWLDAVHADLEAEAYTVGAVDTCAAGFGAPHIRQRFFFVADAPHADGRPRAQRSEEGTRAEGWGLRLSGDRVAGAMANTGGQSVRGRPGRDPDAPREVCGQVRQQRVRPDNGAGCAAGELVYATGGGCGERWRAPVAWRSGHADGAGPVNGFWHNAEWLPCIDGKARPVEPGTFPLVDGAPARLVRLRGYGNGINAENAIAFIEAYLDVREVDPLVSPSQVYP